MTIVSGMIRKLKYWDSYSNDIPMTHARLSLVLLLVVSIGACQTHKIDIQQGNLITETEVSQLEPGMTKREVRYILGTPLVVDPFHQNRWDYFYSLERRGEVKIKRRITVVFESDRMKSIEGDIGVNTKKNIVRDEGGTVITESQQEDKGFFKRTWEKIWDDDE